MMSFRAKQETYESLLREPLRRCRQVRPIPPVETTIPGLVAAHQILGEAHPRVVCGLQEDFDELPVADEEYQYHVVLFSYFRPVSAEELGDAVVAKYPL